MVNYLEQIWPSKPNHYQMSSDTERKQFLKALRFGIDTRNTKENKQELDVLKKLETYLLELEQHTNEQGKLIIKKIREME